MCVGVTGVYNAKNQLTQTTEGDTVTQFTYSYRGSLVTEGATNRYYDCRNRQTTYRDSNNVVTSYTYYIDGLRKSKKVGNGETKYFVWSNGNMVYEFTATDDTKYFFGLHIVSSDDYRYVLNAHGDVIALVSKTGSTVAKYYEYDAFGNEINPNANDTNPYRYCAEYFDIESGTIYLRARYYNPEYGRFTQLDPARDGLNWYAYCGNNPIAFVDPWGLSLTLSGSEDYEQIVELGYLQKLTNHKLACENGRVYIAEYSTENSLSAGNELIERIINSEYNCTVCISYEGGNNAIKGDVDNATNGVGCDAVVSIDLSTYNNEMATYSDETYGTLDNDGRPLHIGLAHELIHADRYMRGVAVSNSEKHTQYYDYYNKSTGKVEQHSRVTKVEEMQTIGIYAKGYPLDRLSITENQIRAEHGLPMRGAHFRAR